MKKIKGMSLLLALALSCQCLCFAALATQDGEAAPSEAVTQAATESPTAGDPTLSTEAATQAPTAAPTEPPTEAPTVDPDAVPEVPAGTNAAVDFGCLSLDAAKPLVSGEKILTSAKGVFVYEVNSGTTLYGYNPDEPLAAGGLSQIMAALLVLEHCNLDDVVNVSTVHINELPLGVRHQNLKNGEQISVRNLLYCMMVASANDAAVVLAERVAGSPAAFVQKMNDRAKELGCTNTVFKNVSGLDAAGQHSTARDMARILAAALEHEEFKTIFAAGTYTVPSTNLSEPRELKTMNYLAEGSSVERFYDERSTGGKASYTSAAAGASIAFTAANDDLDMICVILGATRKYYADNTVSRYGSFEEAKELMDYCFKGFRTSRMLYKGQSILQMKVEDGVNDVVAVNRTDLDIVLPKGVGIEDLKLKYDVTGGSLTAPVEEGQQIVTVQMWYKGSCVGESTLYAKTAVASQDDPGFEIQDGASRSDEDMVKLVIYAGLVLLGFIALAGIYLSINAARRAAAKRRAQKLRRQRRDARMQSRRRYR